MFIKQMNENEEYKDILNDYIHMMSYHDNELELELINKPLDPCDLSSCACALRHHKREELVVMKEIQDKDKSLKFYSLVMDSLHFYLYHLYDVELRIKPNTEITRICRAVDSGKAASQIHSLSFNTILSPTGLFSDAMLAFVA